MPKQPPTSSAKRGNNNLTPLPDAGTPPESRISDASQAMGIYNEMFDADRKSAYNRVRVQELIDGVPPFSRGAMRRQGNAFRTNLNFGEAGAIIDAALSSYYDLVESPEVLARIKLPTTMPDYCDMEDIASEELQRLMRRDWSDFDPRWDVLSAEFVEHGVGISYFPDDDDWKWDSGGWDDFLIPRDTRVSEEEVEILIGIRKMPVHQLYRKIASEEHAKAVGWNVKATRRELVAATTGEASRTNTPSQWANLERQFKNNDYGVSKGGATVVTLLHFWVREFSGKISHYICSRDWKTTPEFLYEKRDRFENANQAFALFTNGVGNGTLHSIRGLGYRIYAPMQELNRVRCTLVDHSKLSSAMIFKRAEHAAGDEPCITFNGPFGIVSSEVNVEVNQIQDRSESLLSVANEMSMLTQNNTGQYRPRAVNPNSTDKTKYEVQAEQELTTRLSTSQVNLFYRSLRKLLAESFRRIVKIGPNNPRFPEVQKYFKRCADRGVPFAVLKQYTEVVPERAIGNGSPAQRQVAFDRLDQIAGGFDELSKNNYMRDKIAHITGSRSFSDRYKPKPDMVRPVIDEQMALFENNDMANGQEAKYLIGQNDAIHAGVHMTEILERINALESIRNTGQEVNIESTMPDLTFLSLALPHVRMHIEALRDDPLRQADYAALSQALQQSTAIFMTYVRQVEQIAREQKPQGPEADPEEVRKNVEFTEKLKKMWIETRTKMALTAAEVEQRMNLRRVEADQRLSDKARQSSERITQSNRKAA